jgi:hypothetical protein
MSAFGMGDTGADTRGARRDSRRSAAPVGDSALARIRANRGALRFLARIGLALQVGGYGTAGVSSVAAVTGCATADSGRPERVILDPEACTVASIHCGAQAWPQCGDLPGEGAEARAVVDYTLCQLQGAARCYLDLTAPGAPCERVEVGP